MKGLNRISFEQVFWISGLILLAFSNPNEHHFSLCPLASLGISWCPGCGIGHAITHLFRGELSASFEAHWFGIPALLLILHRIYQLSVKQLIRQV